MQSIAVFVTVLAVASASTIAYRVPSADSAVINSQRVGGNFAYSTSESAAYGVVSPVVQNVATPVATTYTVQQPAVLTQGVQNVLPLTQNQVATYGVNYAYGALPVAYTAVQGNTVQVDQTKQVAEVRVSPVVQQVQPVVQQVQPVVQQVQPVVQQVQQVQPLVQQVQEVKQVAPVATTYSVQQPTWVQQQVQQVQEVKQVAPVATTYSVQQPTWVQQQVQQVQEVKQVAPVATTYSVQQPTWVQQQGSVVASGYPVATTYSVQAPTSVVQAGTPASTYKPLNGVSPLGVNYAYGYGYGLPYNTVNVNTVV